MWASMRQGSLHQEAQVCQVYRGGERLVQKEHPAGEKAGLGVQRAADVGVISACRGQMQGQLGEADAKQHHDQECDAVGQGRGDAGHGGDELDGDDQPHGGRDVRDALGEDGREREGVGAQAFGRGDGWLHR